eukprot:s2498_g2.t2
MLLRAWVLTAARCAGSCSYIVFGVMLNGRSIEARRMSDALAGLGFDGCAMRWLVFVHCMRCFSFSTVGIEARRMSDALAGLGVAAARCAGSCSDMVFTKVFIMLILLFAGQRCSGANAPGLYTVRRRFRGTPPCLLSRQLSHVQVGMTCAWYLACVCGRSRPQLSHGG